MGEMVCPVDVDSYFQFAPDEAQAAALDEGSDDDMLVLTPDFDLHALIEDELLMAMPLVPRHDTCPEQVPLEVKDAGFDAAHSDQPHPFAALAALKGQGPSGKSS